jgi:hypothetical protein
MAEIVAETDGLNEIFVKPQGPGNGAGDLGHLERVGEPDPVVVSLGGQKDLSLVGEPAERLGVNDAITIAPEGRGQLVLRLRLFPPLGAGGKASTLGQRFGLDLFGQLSRRHKPTVAPGCDGQGGAKYVQIVGIFGSFLHVSLWLTNEGTE